MDEIINRYYYFVIVSEDNVFQSGEETENLKNYDYDIWENEIVGVSDENVAINIYRFVQTVQFVPC